MGNEHTPGINPVARAWATRSSDHAGFSWQGLHFTRDRPDRLLNVTWTVAVRLVPAKIHDPIIVINQRTSWGNVVRAAVPAGVPVFESRVANAPPADILDHYLADIVADFDKARRSRTHGVRHLERVTRLVAAANDFAERWGLKARATMPDGFDAVMVRAKAQRPPPLDAVREREIAMWRNGSRALLPSLIKYLDPGDRALFTARASGGIEDWRAGRRPWQNLPRMHGEVALRLTRNNRIATSIGAYFPLADAIKAWPILRGSQPAGAEIKFREPIKLGDYEITAISADGDVTAGCITVRWAEIERLAKDLGLA